MGTTDEHDHTETARAGIAAASIVATITAVVGAGDVLAAAAVGGPTPDAVDAGVVGVVLLVLGADTYRRERRAEPPAPNALRAAAVVGLWSIAFSLHVDPTASDALTRVAILAGAVVTLVDAPAFARRYAERPRRRRAASRDLADLLAVGRRLGEGLRSLAVVPLERPREVRSALHALPDGDVDLLSTEEGGRPRLVAPVVLTVPIGIGAGLGAAAFRYLMTLVHGLLFGTVLSGLPSHAWIAVLPLVGALLAGTLIHEFAPEAAGHGVPENMEAIATDGGRIRHRLAPFKVLVSALTLGAGGSGGREGPIARIGAGVGSSLGQLFGLSTENTRLLLAAGIAGGIGATFGAPVGGAFFGLEIVMRYRVKVYNVLVLALTTLTAVATADLLAPRFTWFAFLPFQLPTFSVGPADVLVALPYGVLLGIVAWAWVVLLDRTERAFEGVSVPDHLKPAIGALPVGILGIWFAHYGVMGVGYVGLQYAVTNVQVGAGLLLALALAKLVATQFTIGSGGSGGVFAPTLYIGGLFAVGAHQALGLVPESAALIGVVGMGAIFSGAAFAPLTATFLVAEVFGDYALVAILLVPSLVSYLVAHRLLGASIYTSRLQRKGLLAEYGKWADRIGPTTRRDRERSGPSVPVDRATDNPGD